MAKNKSQEITPDKLRYLCTCMCQAFLDSSLKHARTHTKLRYVYQYTTENCYCKLSTETIKVLWLIGPPEHEIHEVLILLGTPPPHGRRHRFLLSASGRPRRRPCSQFTGRPPRARSWLQVVVTGGGRRRWLRRRLPAGRRLLLWLGPDGGLHRPDAQPAHVPQAHCYCDFLDKNALKKMATATCLWKQPGSSTPCTWLYCDLLGKNVLEKMLIGQEITWYNS